MQRAVLIWHKCLIIRSRKTCTFGVKVVRSLCCLGNTSNFKAIRSVHHQVSLFKTSGDIGIKRKNIAWCTTNTSVLWPNPKQWPMIYMPDLNMIKKWGHITIIDRDQLNWNIQPHTLHNIKDSISLSAYNKPHSVRELFSFIQILAFIPVKTLMDHNLICCSTSSIHTTLPGRNGFNLIHTTLARQNRFNSIHTTLTEQNRFN